MLSVFPSLLSWSQAGPLVTRLALAAVLIYWCYRTWRTTGSTTNARILASIQGLAGIFLVVGFMTQIAAIVVAVILISKLIKKSMGRTLFTDGINYYVLLLAIALSLIVTGPGFFAIDYPL